MMITYHLRKKLLQVSWRKAQKQVLIHVQKQVLEQGCQSQNQVRNEIKNKHQVPREQIRPLNI